ncbi:hypothetical protein GQ600_269 [Phytophthora cactorum]|nr:hypothetical protein GQ600_269 [Phytophthora cactorum]
MRSSTVRHGIQRIQRGSSLVYHRWQSLQVSYRGNKYSVERLLALDEYTEKTSVLRVAMVVSGALVPMVILVISQESCRSMTHVKAGVQTMVSGFVWASYRGLNAPAHKGSDHIRPVYLHSDANAIGISYIQVMFYAASDTAYEIQ